MTPKEKALELVEKFKFETKQSEIINDIILGDVSVIFQHHKAKQCALIAVDFAKNSRFSFQPMNGGWVSGQYYYDRIKQEIENL